MVSLYIKAGILGENVNAEWNNKILENQITLLMIWVNVGNCDLCHVFCDWYKNKKMPGALAGHRRH
jgi:hypothetical protein